MNSIALIHNLYRYFFLLQALEVQEQNYCKGTEANPIHFVKSVSIRHNTITAKLNAKNEEGEIAYQDYLKLTFTVNEQDVSFTSIHCEYKERENVIKEYIAATFSSQTQGLDGLSKELTHYLTIADSIAAQAYLCSAGDDYFPGYYSEMIISDAGIELKQINHWNARSIDHKKDYYLRDLAFFIPTGTTEPKNRFNDDNIGRMLISFSDRSSEQNKKCGNEILKMIQEQKAAF